MNCNMNTVTRQMISVLACVIAATAVLAGPCGADAAEKKITKQKLQIVFLFGQSEMAGYADVSSAVYMLQKPLVPPREASLNAHKGNLAQINGAYLYWQAMNSYAGPAEKKAQLKSLIEQRDRFRKTFKQHVLDELTKNNGNFRGKHYATRRGFWLFNMVDQEADKVGITKKIRAILDAPDNAFNVEKAYDQILKDSNRRYRKQLELNRIYLNGATPEDFAAYAEAVKQHQAGAKQAEASSPEDERLAMAELAKKHLHMPVAQKTYICGLGTIAGSPTGDAGNLTCGKLSIGYGAGVKAIGLEYAAGMAIERKIDAPILLVKCAWNNSRASIGQLWRASSMDGVETPHEKQVRETWNTQMLAAWNNKSPQDKQKALQGWEGLPDDKKATTPKPGTPKPAPQKSGKPAWAWKRILPLVKKVLANPGAYHPDYDPKVGYETAGLIWFQGLGERDNPDYGLQLSSMLTDFRKVVNNQHMPVVCATVGTMFFQGESDDNPVNRGMLNLPKTPGFKGTADVIETYKWFPSELGLISSMFFKRRINSGSPAGKAMLATVNKATTTWGRRRPAYSGSASFYLLAGNEVGTSLARMISGGKPTVPAR